MCQRGEGEGCSKGCSKESKANNQEEGCSTPHPRQRKHPNSAAPVMDPVPYSESDSDSDLDFVVDPCDPLAIPYVGPSDVELLVTDYVSGV